MSQGLREANFEAWWKSTSIIGNGPLLPVAMAGWNAGRAALLIEQGREQKATRLVKESGKIVHSNTCATSVAPAEEPGPCDCNVPQPAQEAVAAAPIDDTVRKFGTCSPHRLDVCKACGRIWGEHCDSECPTAQPDLTARELNRELSVCVTFQERLNAILAFAREAVAEYKKQHAHVCGFYDPAEQRIKEATDAQWNLDREAAAQVVNGMDLRVSEHTSPYDAAVTHAVKCRDAIRALPKPAAKEEDKSCPKSK